VVVARSSVEAVETFTIEVESDDVVAPAVVPAGFVASDEEFAGLLGHPIPTPAPVRPFNRNSTLEELEATQLGRLLSSIVVREGVRRSAQEFPDPDDATIAMVRAALREGPARLLVLMGGGILDFEQLDVLLRALDGRWGAAARDAATQVLRRLPRP
jgi:beta-glucosidase